jgi:mRNA interferase RelE/StbE
VVADRKMNEQFWHRMEAAAVAMERIEKELEKEIEKVKRGDELPPGAVKLADSEFWRLRVGDHRIVYVVDDAARLVVVLKVARRSESMYRRVGP